MKRLAVVLIALALLAAPLAGEAQQVGKAVRIGFLGVSSASAATSTVEAF